MTPAFLNYFTEILKNSTLLAGIGVAELAYQAYTLWSHDVPISRAVHSRGGILFAMIFPVSLSVRGALAKLDEKCRSIHLLCGTRKPASGNEQRRT